MSYYTVEINEDGKLSVDGTPLEKEYVTLGNPSYPVTINDKTAKIILIKAEEKYVTEIKNDHIPSIIKTGEIIKNNKNKGDYTHFYTQDILSNETLFSRITHQYPMYEYADIYKHSHDRTQLFSNIVKAISDIKNKNNFLLLDIHSECVLFESPLFGKEGEKKEEGDTSLTKIKLSRLGFVENKSTLDSSKFKYTDSAFTPPECQNFFGKSSDLNIEKAMVWSLGVLFYLILTGKYLWGPYGIGIEHFKEFYDLDGNLVDVPDIGYAPEVEESEYEDDDYTENYNEGENQEGKNIGDEEEEEEEEEEYYIPDGSEFMDEGDEGCGYGISFWGEDVEDNSFEILQQCLNLNPEKRVNLQDLNILIDNVYNEKFMKIIDKINKSGTSNVKVSGGGGLVEKTITQVVNRVNKVKKRSLIKRFQKRKSRKRYKRSFKKMRRKRRGKK